MTVLVLEDAEAVFFGKLKGEEVELCRLLNVLSKNNSET
jgi:hypothetical protein